MGFVTRVSNGLIPILSFMVHAFSYILAAVSPAVVVPSVLALQEKHYGVEKGEQCL